MPPTDLWISLREKLLDTLSGSDHTKTLNLSIALHMDIMFTG
jgi:hypothetical protein